jgi:hypothetical protein
MRTVGIALLLLALLLIASNVGLFLQRWMREHHRSRNTIDSVRLVITMLVTFAALVLGLLVTASKNSFDEHTQVVRHFGTRLIELDFRLREYGPQADPIRAVLRRYTAAMIASTWPNEQVPPGDYPSHLVPAMPNSFESELLTGLFRQAVTMVDNLKSDTSFQTRLAPVAASAMKAALDARWAMIEGALPTISSSFLLLLMLWLVIIFVTFGLASPRNGVIQVVILLSALSVASSLYLIVDLDSPFGGLLWVSSQPMRDALMHMDQPVQWPPP